MEVGRSLFHLCDRCVILSFDFRQECESARPMRTRRRSFQRKKRACRLAIRQTRFVTDTTAPFTVFGINVGIEDGQSQIGNIEKLWTRSSNQIDLDNNFKTKKFPCPNCACAYSQKYSLNRHLTYECGQEPRFKCPHCDYRCKKSANIYEHVRRRHKDCRVYAIDVLKASSRVWFAQHGDSANRPPIEPPLLIKGSSALTLVAARLPIAAL
ncbi:PREDICTED: uncharacterized protein LOC108548457 isoform X1 [Eufriesea mexicana]|uniref:uncharacterized protein LOC108548457 isoform X1 n=1 Tax=Eufriesea mexicana TaxID=516756 RepID=UPI00083BB110|nr:PREDICTED: uncharacterized protein LOC108548457 isoform X1 [Eufriesea mexicana]